MERIFDGQTVKLWYVAETNGKRLWRYIAYKEGKFILGKYVLKQ
jgi:hypothetical protein